MECKCVNYFGRLFYIWVEVNLNFFKDIYVLILIILFYLFLCFLSSKRFIVIFIYIIFYKIFLKLLYIYLLDFLEFNDVFIIDILSDKEVK